MAIKFACFLLICCSIIAEGSHPDSVQLSHIQVLTLKHGKMTNGRRSSPVPQLKCVGGTAGCKAFTPQVVQCYNRGWDGMDVQWECKSDMDNAFRFGEISVSCEGFAYAEDPYVLKGSCGLEYTIDFTKEGYDNQKSKGHDYYGNSHHQSDYSYSKPVKGQSSYLESIIFLAAIGLVIYALYRTCIAPSATEQTYQSSTTNDDFGGYPSGDQRRTFYPNAPPPPGFRSEFTQGAAPSAGASCGPRPANEGSTGAGGFWTGAATGGLLGYMFGNRNNYQPNQTFRSRGGSYFNSNENWGGTTRQTSSSSGSPGRSESTGTRTASGFGGTTRR